MTVLGTLQTIHFKLQKKLRGENRPFHRALKELYVNKPITGVEIGVYKGENAYTMLKNLTNIEKLYLIDPYEMYSEYKDDLPDKNPLDEIRESAEKRLKPYSSRIQFIRKSSEEAWDDVPYGLDFVYIDGNHAYDFVKTDIETYWGLIHPGGVIGGHDINNGFNPDHNGVITAVAECSLKRNRQIHIREPDWWIFK